MLQEIKAICFYSSLLTHHSLLLLRWQISAGQFFEWMMPASFVLAATLSAWVLASVRRYRFSALAATLWTLCTLFFPLITLPLYLIARSMKRRREKERASKAGDNDSQSLADESHAALPLRWTLPPLYLAVMLSLAALHFYMDSRSVDAHLMRANQERLLDQRERVIAEYRAALKLEDSAHTHSLLGKELLAAERWDEALAELRTAERMGEPDDERPFQIAEALLYLKRPAEAKTEYERFLRGPLCTVAVPDRRCRDARQRLSDMPQ
jgi:tetratricopeptide (TPR) repeat protein